MPLDFPQPPMATFDAQAGTNRTMAAHPHPDPGQTVLPAINKAALLFPVFRSADGKPFYQGAIKCPDNIA